MPEVIDDNGTSILDLTDIIDYDLFRMLMQYVYTGTCDIFKPGFKIEISPTKMNGVPKGMGGEMRSIDREPISGESFGVEELAINDKNRHQSALSVYRELQEQGRQKGEGEGKKRGKKDRKKGKGGQTDTPKNQKMGLMSVVKMVIEEAKNFGIKTLAKRYFCIVCISESSGLVIKCPVCNVGHTAIQYEYVCKLWNGSIDNIDSVLYFSCDVNSDLKKI